LQTPATALRPKRAPVLVPSPEAEQEIEVEVEEDVQQEVRNLGDREVEYAGGSSADYGKESIVCIVPLCTTS